MESARRDVVSRVSSKPAWPLTGSSVMAFFTAARSGVGSTSTFRPSCARMTRDVGVPRAAGSRHGASPPWRLDRPQIPGEIEHQQHHQVVPGPREAVTRAGRPSSVGGKISCSDGGERRSPAAPSPARCAPDPEPRRRQRGRGQRQRRACGASESDPQSELDDPSPARADDLAGIHVRGLKPGPITVSGSVQLA